MNNKNYNEALELMRKGGVPHNMDDVKDHAFSAMFELKQYVEALTECCYRLNNTNKVLRQIAEGRINGNNSSSVD